MHSLFQAEGQDWKLEIIGKLPVLPTFLERLPNTSIIAEGVTKMERFDLSNSSQKVIQSGEQIEPIFYESISYDIHFEKTDPSLKICLPAGAEARRIRPTIEHYVINFGNNVGFSNFEIHAPKQTATIRIEVFSRKIDFRHDYQVMRQEVSSILRNLAMAANSKTYSLAAPEKSKNPTLIEWFSLVKNSFSLFMKLAQGIAKNPHSSLVKQTSSVEIERARKISRLEINRSMRRTNSGPLSPISGTSLPGRIKQVVSRSTFDTAENRYFKSLLKETYRKVRALIRIQEPEYEDADRDSEKRYLLSIKSELTAMQIQIESILKTSFLSDVTDMLHVKPDSMVYHKHPLYSRFEKICRLLNGGLSFSGDIVPIGVKDTALLYEYWCFLKIISILQNNFELQDQSIVKIKKLKTVVVLKKGKSSTMRFIHKVSGKELSVIYNRMFNRLPTLAQKPDNVIQFASENRFYIFDAKYRIQFDHEYLKKYGGPGPMEDDINTMHRYRDAIAIPHPVTMEYQRGVVIGAAVLFPYANEDDYLDHRFHKSLELMDIGGIPFLPNATALLEEKINKLLSSEFSNITQ